MSDRGLRSRLELTGLADAVHGRASVRRFAPDRVPREDVSAMVELAIRAANAGNAQMWRFVAVDDAGLRAGMKDAVDAALDEVAAWPEVAGMANELKALRAYSTFFAQAPLVVAVFGLPYGSKADEMLARHGLGAEERDRLRPARHPEHRRRRAAALHGGPRHGLRVLLDDGAGDGGAGDRGHARRRASAEAGRRRPGR